MAGTQTPIGRPNMEDNNFILFGQSSEHMGEQVDQPEGSGRQQNQEQSSASVGRALFREVNHLLLDMQARTLFGALQKTDRTQESRREISGLEKALRNLRQAVVDQDNAPIVRHLDGRVTVPTGTWIHRWRDLQGEYHVTPYKPPKTNPAGYPYQDRADGAPTLRQVAKSLDWQLHSDPRCHMADLEWCVVCGAYHYAQEVRSVDMLLWETFGDENGLLPDEYLTSGQALQMPSLPMCLEWAQFWDWGIIALVPGRTPGSWMIKVVHPDFIQFMASNYPGSEGREISTSPSWQPNPRHLYLRWAVAELLRIHDDGIARPVTPARGVLYWEKGIVDYETGPLGCDLTMVITWLGCELAGLSPEETYALLDIPEDLAKRAKDQLEMKWARQFWMPRLKKFVDAYLAWNAEVGKALAQYRLQMGISSGVSRDEHFEAERRLWTVLEGILGDEDEEPRDAEQQEEAEGQDEEVADEEETDEKMVHQEQSAQVDVEVQEGEEETDSEEEEETDDGAEEQLEFQSSEYDADVEDYFDDWGEDEGSNWNETTDDDEDRATTTDEEEEDDAWMLRGVLELIQVLSRGVMEAALE
ncbi:hypothetical protein MCOR25_006630 [Pyricularia grisea]|nr:hypothetical protein MCOR25_006630 [Pyricularia grisea]